MNILVVVSEPRDWPIAISGVTVLSARDYLTDARWGQVRSCRVFNLCNGYRYQSLGYYVSLLAQARGHKPLPAVGTIEDLGSRVLVRLLTQGLDEMTQRLLAPIKSESFELHIYFGRNSERRYDPLCQHLFNLLEAPLLHAHFERHGLEWRLRSIRPIGAADVPPQHEQLLLSAASAYFSGRKPRIKKLVPPHEIAVLWDPDNPEPPSNRQALHKFELAAQELGMRLSLIQRGDFGRLIEYDALFIRDTTSVNHYTYRFSRRAFAENLVVIDDPDSIVKCGNKVYLAELMARHRVPIPKTMLVHRENVRQVVANLSLPVVLKQPDSSFSVGVVKVHSDEQLHEQVSRLLRKSDLIIAQEYLPTDYDWRIGIIDRRPLFAAKYFMAPGHWQIINHGADSRDYVEGATRAVAIDEVPRRVLNYALKAANLVGSGFYGVDLKAVGNRVYVIEVNDNPNLDVGNEDAVAGDALYREVMTVFRRRIEANKASR